MSNTIKAFFINIGLFIILIFLYFISGFLTGYGSNNGYEAKAWRLYIFFNFKPNCKYPLFQTVLFRA